MVVEIEDDFSLGKIVESGQCFRARMLSPESAFFVTGNRCMEMTRLGDGRYDVSCSSAEWRDTWFGYFDLGRSYSAVRRACAGRHAFADIAIERGRGIRILKQEKWETLVSFIVSQRKSIPSIRKTIEYFARNFGSPIREGVNAFPSPEQLGAASEGQLKESGLGYRLPFVAAAARRALEGAADLEAFDALADEALVERLKTFNGVGDKVANCVALFAYGRTALAPVDVWIQRAIDTCFGGVNVFPEYGESAGIMQQYVFYALRTESVTRR